MSEIPGNQLRLHRGDAPGQPGELSPATIASLDLPPAEPSLVRWLMVAATIALGVPIVLALGISAWRGASAFSVGWPAAVGATVGAAIAAVGWARWARGRRRTEEAIAAAAPPLGDLLRAAGTTLPRAEWVRGSTWQRLEEAAKLGDADVPAAIVDSKLPPPRLGDVPLPNEPVVVLPGGAGGAGMGSGPVVAIVLIALLLLTFAAAQANPIIAVLLSVVFFIVAIQVPAVRRAVPFMRLDNDELTCTPGRVRSARGFTWDREEAILVVRGAAGEEPDRPRIEVCLYGHWGVLRAAFPSTSDREFLRLWILWIAPGSTIGSAGGGD